MTLCFVFGALFYAAGFFIKRSQDRKVPGYAADLNEENEPIPAIEQATAMRRCPWCGEVLLDTMTTCPTCKSPVSL